MDQNIQDIKFLKESLKKIQQKFNRNLVCHLCNSLPLDPRQCPKCEDLFCYDCICNNIKSSDQNCPSCSQSLQVQDFIEPSRLINTLINETQIHECPQCFQVDQSFEKLKNHLQSECPMMKIFCQRGCGVVIYRGKQNQHLCNARQSYVYASINGGDDHQCQNCQEFNDREQKLQDQIQQLQTIINEKDLQINNLKAEIWKKNQSLLEQQNDNTLVGVKLQNSYHLQKEMERKIEDIYQKYKSILVPQEQDQVQFCYQKLKCLDSHYQCIFCKSVAFDNKLDQGVLKCRRCIDQQIKVSQNQWHPAFVEGLTTLPVDNARIEQCIFCQDKSITTFYQFTLHIYNQSCTKLRLQCPLQCGLSYTKDQLRAHLNECQKISILCNKCGQVESSRTYKDHDCHLVLLRKIEGRLNKYQ